MSNCCQNEIHSCPLKCGKTVTLSEVDEHFKREKDIHQKEILNLFMEERLSLVSIFSNVNKCLCDLQEKQEPITINTILVEWDVNLGEGDLSFAELEIVAKGEETAVKVYLVIQNKIGLPAILTDRNVSNFFFYM